MNPFEESESDVHAKAHELWNLLNDSMSEDQADARKIALAKTHLEQGMMWYEKAITPAPAVAAPHAA